MAARASTTTEATSPRASATENAVKREASRNTSHGEKLQMRSVISRSLARCPGAALVVLMQEPLQAGEQVEGAREREGITLPCPGDRPAQPPAAGGRYVEDDFHADILRNARARIPRENP